MKQIKHLFATHGLTIIRAILLAAFGFVIFTIINLQQANKDILIHVKNQQDAGDRQREDLKQAVKDLTEDNANQTLILCTIFLSDKVDVSPQDATQIETICKQKIQHASDPKALAPETGAMSVEPAPNFTQLNQADPTPQQEMAVNPPPDEPKQPEPNMVQRIIYNITNTVKGLVQ